LRDRRLQFSDALSRTAEVSKLFSFTRLRGLDTRQGLARDRLVARRLRP